MLAAGVRLTIWIAPHHVDRLHAHIPGLAGVVYRTALLAHGSRDCNSSRWARRTHQSGVVRRVNAARIPHLPIRGFPCMKGLSMLPDTSVIGTGCCEGSAPCCMPCG
eukprot:scaffold673_cov410-Prasinococcus_capsulatus_cf.AAC.14